METPGPFKDKVILGLEGTATPWLYTAECWPRLVMTIPVKDELLKQGVQ